MDFARSALDSGRVLDESAIAEEIRDVERRRLRSLVEGDLATAGELHGDDYQLVTPGGATLSKDDYLGGIASGDLDYHVFEADSDMAVRVTRDTAIVRYQARIEIEFAGQFDSGLFWHTDYYERRDGRWQAVWSQATQVSR